MISFINDNYNLIRKSTSNEVCPKYFLLGEIHNSEEIKKINGLFISTFATEKSVVLFESNDSMEPVDDVESMLEYFFIDSEKLENKNVLGWDVASICRELDNLTTAYTLFLEILNRPDFNSEEMIPCFSKTIQTYIDRRYEKIKERFSEITEKQKRFIEESREEILKKGVEVQKFLESALACGMLDAAIGKLKADFQYWIHVKGFSIRTDAMKKTLVEVEKKSDVDYVFLIAGFAHLEKVRKDTTVNNSIDSFYQFLDQNGLNAVSLYPKSS